MSEPHSQDVSHELDVMFYHLRHQPLEKAVAQLLEKTLARGWKAYIHCGNPSRLASLDDALWTYDDAAFLPHDLVNLGQQTQDIARNLGASQQPILLSDEYLPLNQPDVLFLVEGAEFPILPSPDAPDAPDTETAGVQTASLKRIIMMFHDSDAALLDHARQSWKAIKARGLDASYWQQDDDNRWVKKA